MTTFEFKMTHGRITPGGGCCNGSSCGYNGCFAPYVRCWQWRVFYCIFCCKM